MNYPISEILKVTGAELLNKIVYSGSISEIYFDTRRGSYGPNALFLAIDGKNADGHNYIDHAYKSLGSRQFLVSKQIDISHYPNANFLLCNDVIKALQLLASYHRKKYSPIVIGITGSNGKTIVKEWIQQLCSDHYDIVRSPGSYNSQIGVPLSVLMLRKQHQVGIFEAGISGRDEMEYIEEVIKPEIGIFTNIGEAHSAGFSSLEEKIDEKAKLFKECKKVIYCSDHKNIKKVLRKLGTRLISWSTSEKDATYHVSYEDRDILINKHRYSIPFSDHLSRQNATFAIVTALELGLQNLKTDELATLKMRLEMKQGINNSFLINDAYNSDFNALKSALKILEQQEKKQRNTLILSQIEETNLSAEDSVNRISELIESHDIHRLITVGENLMSIDFSGDFHKYPNTASLVQDLKFLHFQNENVLIKGARKFSLEQIFDSLSVKVHQTILEIDLEAMRHNLQVYRSFLSADTKLMVVLKASGYGSGSKELSRFLAYQRADYIAVAYVDEGVELRKSGIEVPIMVMNPEESGFASMIKYGLEPEIYSKQQLKTYLTYLESDKYTIHLKIETGMHRLGISYDDLTELAQMILAEDKITVGSIFSHLVGSDDQKLDEFSFEQIDRFDRAYNVLCQFLTYAPDRHILNSNGISRFPMFQYEMVRLGIGLHGLSDDQKLKSRLLKVQKLTTKIAQIKNIDAGESVGYSRSFVAKQSRKIATINIGYADGLPRNAGNKKFSVLVNGRDQCPIVGNVCMDMSMLDVTDINVKVGDEVMVFGQEWPIEKLAEACGTIPYEILTRLSTRVHRIFSRE